MKERSTLRRLSVLGVQVAAIVFAMAFGMDLVSGGMNGDEIWLRLARHALIGLGVGLFCVGFLAVLQIVFGFLINGTKRDK